MKYNNFTTIVAFFISLLFSCSLFTPPLELQVRIVLVSRFGQASTAKAYVESTDGNLLTGARIVIRNSDGVSSLLNFDFAESAYLALLPPSTDGNYDITIHSILLKDSFSQTIKHRVLSDSPQIIVLQDEAAHSALSGGTLNTNKIINVEWTPVADATVYQITVNKGGSAVFVQSVSGTAIGIPATNLGTAGTFSVSVMAQYITGDPLLETENFYSYSEKTGSSVLFITQ